MASKLEQLLMKIDPMKSYDPVAKRVDNAINSFTISKYRYDTYEEFNFLLSRFCFHLETAALKVAGKFGFNQKMYKAKAEFLLSTLFGQNWYHTSFSIATTGTEGGIYRLLKQIGNRMGEEHISNYIGYHVMKYWENLTNDEKLVAQDEYIAKYGHLLPDVVTTNNALRIRAFFIKVLKQHPKTLLQLRQVR